ncbi:MAG: ABC transporter ATP-binding protein [Flavobacteriaceae bacterium]|nr:ABC transporter ATP-binding protein [Flavobacteriaceae bacterium]
MSKALIHINQLAKKYKDSDYFAVNPLRLSIQKNEIFGLIGPNGAGKTTLISMLCGLVKPTAGTIEIKELNYRKNKNKIQNIIGVVPQEYALYPTLTAFENLMYFGAMYGLKGENFKNKIKESLKRLGLTRFTNKKIKTFSGGMKRRVNLIAGTLHNPEILFLDEPTVGVDVQSKNVIIQHLKQLNKEGSTIVYTSHHMLEAEDFCTDVAIIDDGNIIARGHPTELIKSVKMASNLEEVYLNLTGGELRDYA